MVKEIKEYTKMEKLDQWLQQLIFPGNVEDFIQELEGRSTPGEEVYRRFCFYTENHTYFIVAEDRTKDDGYLGCQVQCRKPRPGEDWLRGNDLPDGKFIQPTWNLIEKAVMNYELVKLSDFRKPETGDIQNDDS